MEKIDNRNIGKGLKNKDVLRVLLSLTPEELENDFHIEGVNDVGHDFISYIGPMEHERRFIDSSGKPPFVEKGELVAILQNHTLIFDAAIFLHPQTDTYPR